MRIVQNSVFLLSLVKLVKNGSLVPAAFQRPYVWSENDVLALLTSLMKGYPIGGMLAWSPLGHADISKVTRARIGPISGDITLDHLSLLLDGQNRLATLAWLHHVPGTTLPDDLSAMEREVWGSGRELVVDILNQKMMFAPAGASHEGYLLPARVLVDMDFHTKTVRQRLNGAWRDVADDDLDKPLTWLDATANRIRDARVTVTNIEEASAAEAKDAFMHICRVGVPMAEADFDAALSWAA